MTTLQFGPLPAAPLASECTDTEDVEPIPFFPDDLPDLDMTAGGWEGDEMRTAIITARRQLHLDNSTLVGSMSNV